MMDQGPEAPTDNQADSPSQADIPADRQAGSDQKLPALEAVLFMAAEPIPAAELAEILDVTPAEADRMAGSLADQYAGRGIQISRVAGGYQVCTRPEYGPYVARLHKPERFRLSRAALETLAIVAYKQPVTRPEIEAIRGVNSDSAVDTLVQYELICEAGRKDAPGRPLLYRTTDSFLGQFGLDSVEDLPQIDAIPVDEVAVKAEQDERATDHGAEPVAPESNGDGWVQEPDPQRGAEGEAPGETQEPSA